MFYSLRRVPEIRQPAIAELGCLGLVFLCHLPKLACSLLVAGQACIACAHQSEVRALHDRCASRYLGVVGFFWLGTRKNPDLSVGGLNLCHFPCRLGSAGTGKSWLPDSNNRPAAADRWPCHEAPLRQVMCEGKLPASLALAAKTLFFRANLRRQQCLHRASLQC